MAIVKSLSVGDGDTFYIRHDSDSFTIIDCCLSEDDKERIVDELIDQSKSKGIRRFISTHPDDDHFLGLEYLDNRMQIINFYCVKNEATKPDKSSDFDKYCELRDSTKAFFLSKGCKRKWLNEDGPDNDGQERGGAGISVLWPDTTNIDYIEELKKAKAGTSFNNISAIIQYNCGPKFLWMGDLESAMMEKIKNKLTLPKINILFAPHHGRDTGKIPDDLLKAMNPDIIIVGEAASKDLHYYPDYQTITQNSAGDITFECDGNKVHIYVSNENYSVDFLEDEEKSTFDYYIGTLNCS